MSRMSSAALVRGLSNAAKALALTAVVMTACAGGGRGLRSRPLTDEQTVAVFKDDVVTPPTPAPDWRVYLDGSESMRGFATGGGLFPKIIDDIADLLAASASESTTARFYRFGADIAEQKPSGDRWFQRAGRNPDIFGAAHTDIGAVIGKIVVDQNPPEVALIITDGVQSTADMAAVSPLITRTSQWLSWGYEFGVIAVKSSFKGKAFSEVKSCISVGEYLGDRPFYIFVYATSRGAYEKVLSAVSRGIAGDQDRKAALRSVLLSGKLLGDPKTTILGSSGRPNVFRGGPRPKTHPVAHMYWVGDPELCGPGSFRAQFNVAVDNYALAMLPSEKTKSIRCDVRKRSYAMGAERRETEVTVVSTDARVSADRRHTRRIFTCQLAVANVRDTGRHVIRADVVLPSENLIVPAWVDSFSITDDSNKDDYARTYNFNRLIHALMTRTSFNDQLLGTVYVEFCKPPVK